MKLYDKLLDVLYSEKENDIPDMFDAVTDLQLVLLVAMTDNMSHEDKLMTVANITEAVNKHLINGTTALERDINETLH